VAFYVVVYDLKRPGQNYPELIEHLESYPHHWHFQQSGWLVGPAESAYAVADAAKAYLDAKDVIFAQRLTEDSASWGYTPEGNEWIAAAAG